VKGEEKMESDTVIEGRDDGYTPLKQIKRREYGVSRSQTQVHGLLSAGICTEEPDVDRIALTLFRFDGEWEHYAIHLDAVPTRKSPLSALSGSDRRHDCWNVLYGSADDIGSDEDKLELHFARARGVYERISRVLEAGKFRLHLLHDGQMSLEELF